jgi:threonine aldolase
MAVQANELFVAMPADTIARLRSAGYEFYDWPAPAGIADPVVRLVAAYDMLPEDAGGLLTAARG